MWRASYQANYQNNTILHRVIMEFIFATFLAYCTSLIWNCVNYFFLINFTNKKKIIIMPIIERWIVWNTLFFLIFLTYAKFIIKPLIYKGRKRYSINALLTRSGVMPLMDISIITQFIVFFTPKGFYLYSIIPIHHIILYIREKFQI